MTQVERTKNEAVAWIEDLKERGESGRFTFVEETNGRGGWHLDLIVLQTNNSRKSSGLYSMEFESEENTNHEILSGYELIKRIVGPHGIYESAKVYLEAGESE